MGWKWICRGIEPDLWPYAEGKLSEARARQVAAHLERCSSCRHHFEEYRVTATLTTELCAAPVPETQTTWAALRAQIEQEQASVPPSVVLPERRRFVWSLSAPVLAGAACAVVVVALLVVGLRGSSPNSIAKTDNPPSKPQPEKGAMPHSPKVPPTVPPAIVRKKDRPLLAATPAEPSNPVIRRQPRRNRWAYRRRRHSPWQSIAKRPVYRHRTDTPVVARAPRPAAPDLREVALQTASDPTVQSYVEQATAPLIEFLVAQQQQTEQIEEQEAW